VRLGEQVACGLRDGGHDREVLREAASGWRDRGTRHFRSRRGSPVSRRSVLPAGVELDGEGLAPLSTRERPSSPFGSEWVPTPTFCEPESTGFRDNPHDLRPAPG
jgi:hypothetical protein